MNQKDKELFGFVDRAGKATYAGDGKVEKIPERPGFIELTYSENDLTYRDSYTGHYRSRGMEVVRKKGVPVWTSMYGGGMVGGKEQLAGETFDFLKRAMSAGEPGFASFRGPHTFQDGEWKYTYKQEGDVNEFNGYEEIYYQGELVFFHRVIGGLVKNR